MKIRKGFVSNSSSSSFIVGIAEICDRTKFDAYIEKHQIDLNGYDQYIVTEDCDESEHWDVVKCDDLITVNSFEVSVSTEVKKPDSQFFVVNISNDEGDSNFWNERYGEMEYDIDIDYFSKDQRKVYDAFFDKDSGLNMENEVTFGAARNG